MVIICLKLLDSSSSSYHTCTSAEISKSSPPLEATAAGGAPATSKRRVEFVLDNISADARNNCQVSVLHWANPLPIALLLFCILSIISKGLQIGRAGQN